MNKNITVIIANREGEMINYIIDNFKITYPKYDFKFIIINQEDNEPFARGQLYNIASQYVDTEYLILLDNDVINLHKINLVKEYKKYNKPIVLFGNVAQCYIKDNEPIIYSAENRKDAYGAFVFMKKTDFENCYGFSNLCFCWGAEDNIFNLRANCIKMNDNEIGHIMHPSRKNMHLNIKDNNRKIYLMQKNRQIEPAEDGYLQTTYEKVYDNEDGNIRTIGVTNIGVIKNYLYNNLYKTALQIAKNDVQKDMIYDKGVSICIAAYKAKNTIKETLDSIITQTWVYSHKNWEILVGIDGCEETLEYMKTIMNNYKNLRVFMMDSNQGTYITSNTLIGKIAKYDYVVRFDADDLMTEDYIEELMLSVDKGDVYRFLFKYLNLPPGRTTNNKLTSTGQIAIKKDIFKKFGGYRPWLCAADAEFMTRIEKFVKQKRIEKPCVLKRYVETSLMNAEKTKYPNSPLREKYHKFIENEIINKEEDAIIEMETNTYTEIFSNVYNYNQSSYICLINPDLINTKNDIRKSENGERKLVKRHPAYSPTQDVPMEKAYTVKIISKPVKRTVMASKVNII